MIKQQDEKIAKLSKQNQRLCNEIKFLVKSMEESKIELAAFETENNELRELIR